MVGDQTLAEIVAAHQRGEVLAGAPFYLVEEVEHDSNATGRRFGSIAQWMADHPEEPRRERVRKGTCEHSQLDEEDELHCDAPQPSVYAIETLTPSVLRVDGLCMRPQMDDETGEITLVPGCGFEVHRAGWKSREARDAHREAYPRATIDGEA
jgi:hypothetical protein